MRALSLLFGAASSFAILELWAKKATTRKRGGKKVSTALSRLTIFLCFLEEGALLLVASRYRSLPLRSAQSISS